MRAEKQLLLDEIKNQLEKYQSLLLMSYEQFTANSANDFRSEISNLGGDVEIVKKRLLVKAAQEANIDLDEDKLQGHIGLVFAGEDPIPVTKAVFKLSEASKGVQVIGARFDGELLSAEDVEMLSKLPGKDEMRAQLLGILSAPLSQTVGVMNSLLGSIINCLEGKSQKEGS